MLTITPITNVKNTINNINRANASKVAFTSGIRVNTGADVINNTGNSSNFFSDIATSFTQSPLFNKTISDRENSIEEGIAVEQRRLNAIA